MKKIIFLFLVLGFLAGKAQEEKSRFIKKGLFRTTATLSVGVLLKEKTSMIYGQGIIEYYVADNVSMRGEGFFTVGQGNDLLKYNHSIITGANFHMKTKNHFDPYFGFLLGIAIAKYSGVEVQCITTPCPPLNPGPQVASPVISIPLGFNFYFQRLFHLFFETRFIYGKHISYGQTISLNELRFSFGLGFNFNFKKKEEQK